MATSASRDDRDSFQLPQQGLFADLDSGVGSVAFTDELLQVESVLQISIMQDWQIAIGAHLRDLHVRHFRKITADYDEIGLPERIALYRKHCAEMGIDMPLNFILMLQQA